MKAAANTQNDYKEQSIAMNLEKKSNCIASEQNLQKTGTTS